MGLKRKLGTAAAIGLGMGAAVYSSHPLRGARDLTMDAMFSTPELEAQGVNGSDIDNMVLGGDMSPSELFGLPSLPHPIRALKRAFSTENITSAGAYYKGLDRIEGMKMNAWNRVNREVNERGASTDEFWAGQFGLPYRAGVNSVYSDGSMVFGAYNRRHR